MKYNFIIPYRNRKEHLDEFIRRFTEMLKDKDIDAQFYIIHQINSNEFNRGALKNIGFLEFLKVRPDGLFIFHDVDTLPTYWGSIKYEAKPGEIRHSVGEKNHNLGTICSFWKNEFEKVNGFPNYWGWGIEDVTIWYRAKKLNITIDETNISDLNDSKKVYNPKHYRDVKKEYASANKNTELHQIEMKTNNPYNGLSNIEYEVLSTFELAPNFTVINVDIKIKNES
jgi:beta-1,4-galactosyltransferase 1